MPREDARARAARLLTERRVMIVRVLQTSALAFVRGDSGELREVSWDPRRGWRCSCPAIGFCAHGHAVASVVAVPPASTAELLRDAASTPMSPSGRGDSPRGSPRPPRAGSLRERSLDPSGLGTRRADVGTVGGSSA